MDREYYLDLAARGLSMPIAADLVLHEHADAEEILLDGERLGSVIEETANRFSTPLAVPHMDLELEKKTLTEMIGVAAEERAKFHFASAPSPRCYRPRPGPAERSLAARDAGAGGRDQLHRQAHLADPDRHVHRTVLPDDQTRHRPNHAVCMAGIGHDRQDDDSIRLVEGVLELGMRIICTTSNSRSVREQKQSSSPSPRLTRSTSHQTDRGRFRHIRPLRDGLQPPREVSTGSHGVD